MQWTQVEKQLINGTPGMLNTGEIPIGASASQGMAKRFLRLAQRVGLAAALSLLLSCEPTAVDSRPELVVREFIERMNRVHGEPLAARAAYDLLWSEAKKNLSERAKRATAVLGKTVTPEEMLAPSRFSLNFKPKAFRARIQDRWAIVTVTGEVAATQQAEVKCTEEASGWRVALELPMVSPIRKRANDAAPDAAP